MAGSETAGASSSTSVSGAKRRPSRRASQFPWCLRKRADSPSPICTEIFTSFARLTLPGIPIQIGRSVPRRRTSPIHQTIVAASKQIWLMMCVAIGALANIARIVSSSEIRWWLSG